VARDTAVKAKSAAIITLKTPIVNAPSDHGFFAGRGIGLGSQVPACHYQASVS